MLEDIMKWVLANAVAISAIATAAVAVLTLGVVLVTRRVSNVTRLMIQSQIIIDLRRRYAQNDMLAAMRALRAYQKTHGSNFVAAFLKEREQKVDWQLDADRRIVAHYFYDALLLHRVGAIDSKLLKNLLLKYHFDYLFEVVAPIEVQMVAGEESAFRIAYADRLCRKIHGSSVWAGGLRGGQS